MFNEFLFSTQHLIILSLFSVFLFICPRLTKNLLPYSYLVEKIICLFIILEIILEQAFLISSDSYNVLTSLPLDISRICAYLAVAILFFKQYQLFDVFFSWSIVCSVGEIIFFKDIGYRFPHTLHFLFIFSKCVLVYTTVYLVEVRKFKISSLAIKYNLVACLLFFLPIIFLNIFIGGSYSYSFSSHTFLSIFIFICSTTLVYVLSFLFDKDLFNSDLINIKMKSKTKK